MHDTKDWHKTHNDCIQKKQSVVFIITHLDKFLAVVFNASDDFSNRSAVLAQNLENKLKGSYKNGTMTIAVNIVEMRKWEERNLLSNVLIKVMMTSKDAKVV